MGTPQQEVARMLGVTRQTLWTYLKDPEMREQLRAWRDQFKMVIGQRLAENTANRAVDMLSRTIDEHDTRGADSAARAVMSMEKTMASVSGDARADVQVTVQQANVDVDALLAALDEHRRSG